MKSNPTPIKSLGFLVILVLAAAACLTPAVSTPTAAPEATEADTMDPSEVVTEEEPANTEENTADPAPTDPSEPPETADRSPSANLDTVFEPFWESRVLLHEYFVDQPIDDSALAQAATDGLLESAGISQVEISEELAREFSDAAGTPGELENEFKGFWQAWAAVNPEDETLAMRTALTAMIDSLGDEHTSYMDPDELFQASLPIEGSYEGIGAWVDPDGEYLTIVSPMPDSPAEEAGLLPGDQVIAVDGEDMTGVDGNLVIRRVLGPAGTDVTLTIRREGEEDFDVVITRAEIVVPSIEGRILEDTDIAYIQLFSFGATTADDMRDILAELLAENPSGLILDLRNNGGGLLSAAIEIASEFIDDGVVMYEVFGDETTQEYEAIGNGLATDIPLVILVNSGSASASEIVAGAIQDFDRAPLIGTTTFGKGSVQYWLDLPDNGAVRITIARWYTPDQRLIHEIGLTPDIEVELTDEDVAEGLDPQLDAAVDYLTNP